MAKRKKKQNDTPIFKRGVTLADGRRFEAGDEVPELTNHEQTVLETLDAFYVIAEEVE